MAPPERVSHVFRAGETLWRIAESELRQEKPHEKPTEIAIGVRVRELARINSLKNPDVLFPGQAIFFSKTSTPFPVQSGYAPLWDGVFELSGMPADPARFNQLLAQRKPVDYAQMFGASRVIFVSDHHDPTAAEETELIQNMSQFKKLGITHLGMEMIPSDFQPLMDLYFEQGGEMPSQVADHIKHRNSNPKIVEGYLQLIASARAAGIRIVAIEHPEVSRGLGQDSTFGLEERNPHWAKRISDVLASNFNNRMLVFGGGGHFGYVVTRDTVNLQVEDQARVMGRVINMTNWNIENSVKTVGLVNERFMVPGSRYVNPGADYVVHLPGRHSS